MSHQDDFRIEHQEVHDDKEQPQFGDHGSAPQPTTSERDDGNPPPSEQKEPKFHSPPSRRSRARLREPALFHHLDSAASISWTPMLWGPPGIGKTAQVREWAKARDRKIFVVALSQLDSVDVRGLPAPVHGRTAYLRPNFLPNLDEGPCVLFLDEFTNASITVHRAVYELVQERRIGDHRLPKDCFIICAGNRPEDRAGLQPLPEPLSNRLLHLDIKPDVAAWLSWAKHRNFDRSILDFITVYPTQLWRGPVGKSGTASAFPTPRSWEAIALLLIHPRPETLDDALICGLLGPDTALLFRSFVDSRIRVSDLKRLLKNPQNHPIPPTFQHLEILNSYIAARLADDAKDHQDLLESIAVLMKRLGPDRGGQLGRTAITCSDQARWNTNLKAILRQYEGGNEAR